MNHQKKTIGAVVLGAGQARRMGASKLLMPWLGATTIIQHILNQLKTAKIQPIMMVIGKKSSKLNSIIVENELFAIVNPSFADGSMLHSVQIGIREILKYPVQGILIVLGDQPAIEVAMICHLIDKFNTTNKKIVVPEYGGHKGHPWILNSGAALEILKLEEPDTLRTFLKSNQSEIEYLTLQDSSILSDIDTREDYKKQITQNRV
jgi:molybdenum cofactor cytidylyltransferase